MQPATDQIRAAQERFDVDVPKRFFEVRRALSLWLAGAVVFAYSSVRFCIDMSARTNVPDFVQTQVFAVLVATGTLLASWFVARQFWDWLRLLGYRLALGLAVAGLAMPGLVAGTGGPWSPWAKELPAWGAFADHAFFGGALWFLFSLALLILLLTGGTRRFFVGLDGHCPACRSARLSGDGSEPGLTRWECPSCRKLIVWRLPS